MNKQFFAILSLVMLMLSGVVNAAGNVEAGKAKSGVCVGCHAADGNSVIVANPKLAGQGAAYIAKQLQDFKTNKRDNAVMFGMVQGLSDADMMDLGAFYASNKVKVGKADKNLIKRGEEIYRAGDASKGLSACIGCHGPTGTGNPAAKFPALSGQHADYTVAQLKSFSLGKRANDTGEMMQSISGKMNDADMKAVASYIQGLR